MRGRDIRMITRAETLARLMHAGQWYGTMPYIQHVREVAEWLAKNLAPTATNMLLLQTAWLHDIVEDTDVTLHDLTVFGFDGAVISAVQALTHLGHNETYFEYIERLSKNGIAVIVKDADLRMHLAHHTTLPDDQRERYTRALALLGT